MIVDLFAGPGGLDVAAHWLGVPSIGIEFDESAVETREAAGLSSILCDVTEWKPTDFTESINVLAGGPPCQTFTVAGKGHGRRALARVIELVEMLGDGRVNEVNEEVQQHDDPRTGLVLQPLIWALLALDAGRPFEAILLEQVPAVKPVWEAMARVLESKGYGADVAVLRTEEYGVPQTRRRAVLAARWQVDGMNVNLPQPTHQKYSVTSAGARPRLDPSTGRPKWISMGEALAWNEPFTVISNYSLGGDASTRCRRRHDQPAFTVTGKVSRNRVKMGGGGERRFGHSEAGRLQTFPIDYPWSGSDISQQIGNAIPPRLGAHVLAWLVGAAPELSDQFFETRVGAWGAPTRATAKRLRATVVGDGFGADSVTRLVGSPDRSVELAAIHHGATSDRVLLERVIPAERSGRPARISVKA